MAGRVIERTATQIIDGYIHHDDRPLAWTDADLMAGQKLDRRKNWAFVEGTLCEAACWSSACSGCYEGYDGDSSRGSGCNECGYQGRVHNSAWVPASINAALKSTAAKEGGK